MVKKKKTDQISNNKRFERFIIEKFDSIDHEMTAGKYCNWWICIISIRDRDVDGSGSFIFCFFLGAFSI